MNEKNDYLNNIDFSRISAQEFETLALEYITEIFSEPNTTIDPTRYKKDGGKDIIITHISKITNYRTWVECKNHKRNLGLAEIGKNVVLIISNRINKLIYISASSITETAQTEILYVGEKNNFEVLFLDGDNYKRELLKYPDILEKYFPNSFKKKTIPLSDISISSFMSEFENGIDCVPNSQMLFYLERGNTFYLNFIIKNHTDYSIDKLQIKATTEDDDLFIVKPSEKAITINKMSDYSIRFFCVYLGYDKKKKLPDYEITFLHNGKWNQKMVHNLSISLENIIRIPLIGKRINEFIGISWRKILDLLKRYYSQAVIVYGNSGTGKTRLLEEMILISKQNNLSTKFVDCKNKNGVTILKSVLSFVLEVPFDNNSLHYSKNDIRQIIENEYGKHQYIECLYDLFVNNKLDENTIFYISRLLIYFVQHPRFTTPQIMFIDNIQECDEYVVDIFKKLIDEMQHFSSPFAIVFSANTEVSLSSIEIKNFIKFLIDIENSTSSYCYSFEVKDFDNIDAYLFLKNLFNGIEDEDPIIKQFIQKSGTRPFEMLMLYEYLIQNKILVKGNILNLPSITKYKEFLECIPPKINSLLSERMKSLKKNLSKEVWEECVKVIKCTVFFYNRLPSIFVDDFLHTTNAKSILLKGLIIKFEKYSNNLEFYHDTLYRFFLNEPEYNDIGTLGLSILDWVKTHAELEIEHREKVIFYCHLKTGQLSKATKLGIHLMYSYFEAFDFKSAYEISSKLYELNRVQHDSLDYFRLCYIYAMSSWETIDAYKTLELYEEIHKLLDEFTDEIPINELCRYYREYINANNHAGLFMNNKKLLDEFKAIPNVPIEYQFVIHNRYTVFYMRTNNFYLAKEHGDMAYKIAETLKDNFLLSTSCSDIAFNYLYNKKDFENAKLYFQKAVNYYELCEDRTYFRALEIYNQKALICLLNHNYSTAIKELNRSIKESRQKNNMYMEAKALNYKGIVQTHSGDYKNALTTWLNAIRINEKLGNFSSLICVYFNISSLFMLQDNYKKAFEFANKSIMYLNDENNPVKWASNFDPLFHNYLICCKNLNLNSEAQKILSKYPQYNEFYENLYHILSVEDFLTSESMNYYGLNGYSFL